MFKAPTLLLAVCLAFAGSPIASAQPHDNSADEAAVAQVVESFRTSIINKDKATYMSLFFSDKPEDIGWQFVSEDIRLEHIRKTKPDAIKARQIPRVNFISLIDNVVATEEPREETFSGISIDTDGEIASVSFDYTFLANGKKTNWGREMWQLIRTEGGWKIFSVIYTIRDKWSAGEDVTPPAR
ncbi:MAG: nuclear transport factor 2 family protein [Lysobacter sp.]